MQINDNHELFYSVTSLHIRQLLNSFEPAVVKSVIDAVDAVVPYIGEEPGIPTCYLMWHETEMLPHKHPYEARVKGAKFGPSLDACLLHAAKVAQEMIEGIESLAPRELVACLDRAAKDRSCS